MNYANECPHYVCVCVRTAIVPQWAFGRSTVSVGLSKGVTVLGVGTFILWPPSIGSQRPTSP